MEHQKHTFYGALVLLQKNCCDYIANDKLGVRIYLEDGVLVDEKDSQSFTFSVHSNAVVWSCHRRNAKDMLTELAKQWLSESDSHCVVNTDSHAATRKNAFKYCAEQLLNTIPQLAYFDHDDED